jgi:glutathione S-transferase
MQGETAAEAPWELIYWGDWKEGVNHMIGRGEFVRLIFEEAGVPYIERGKEEGFVAKFVFQGGNTDFPAFAPPIIKKGDFVLSQTSSILRYLGGEFGLVPENKIDAAHADVVCQTAMDFIAEGRLAFHPKEPRASYYTQIEEAKVEVEKFVAERLARWLNYFEKVAAQSTTGYMAGTFSYADLSVFHVLCAAESQFPEYATLIQDCPKLASFKQLVASRPRLAEYLASDRRGKFEGNSMM